MQPCKALFAEHAGVIMLYTYADKDTNRQNTVVADVKKPQFLSSGPKNLQYNYDNLTVVDRCSG